MVEYMSKRFLSGVFGLIAAVILLTACKDPVFYTISLEVEPIQPRIKGTPTNFVVYKVNNEKTKFLDEISMFVATSTRLYRYKNGKWDRSAVPSPGGKITALAAAGEYLYALCFEDRNSPSSAVVKRYDGGEWITIRGSKAGFSRISTIYAAGDTLFVGAENRKTPFPEAIIFYVDDDTEQLVPMIRTGQRALLCGAAFDGTDYYLCTEGRTLSDDEKYGGIYKVNAPSRDLTPSDHLIDGTAGFEFAGMISIKSNMIAAITRGGNLYLIENGVFLRSWFASFSGSFFTTGALAIYENMEGNKLLLAGRQNQPQYGINSGYTYGYLELLLDNSGFPISNFREPGTGFPPTSIAGSSNERFTSTIGKEPVNHLFQAPVEVEPPKPNNPVNRTMFASTVKNGVWSYRDRTGGYQWNAEP